MKTDWAAVRAEEKRCDGDRADGKEYLKRSSEQHRFSHLQEILHGKFYADANRRITTPICARVSTSFSFVTSPNPAGPQARR